VLRPTADDFPPIRELPPEQAACDAWPIVCAGDRIILFTKKQEGFHEAHEAEENSALRAELNHGRRAAPESSFLLLRDGIESAGRRAGPPLTSQTAANHP
jgi:hypothetical protein